MPTKRRPFPARSGALSPRSVDTRDWVLDARAEERDPASETPTKLLHHPFPARDQGAVPCCVSAAIVVCMEVLDALNESKATAAEDRALSILFHYYVAREPNRTSSWVGLYMHDALAVAATGGISSSRYHFPGQPIDKIIAKKPPNPAARENAKKQALVSGFDRRTGRARVGYSTLEVGNRVDNWKLAITSNQPVLANFFLTRGYDQLGEKDNGGVLRWPTAESPNFSHAVAIVGFDEARRAFHVKDSRGPKFGDGKGHWWFPYDAAARLVRESYAIKRIDYR